MRTLKLGGEGVSDLECIQCGFAAAVGYNGEKSQLMKNTVKTTPSVLQQGVAIQLLYGFSFLQRIFHDRTLASSKTGLLWISVERT